MILVHGTIKDGNNSLDYQVLLDEDNIDDRSMPIRESNKLIIDAINDKYKTNYPLYSELNPVKIRKPETKK